ncbi:MAG: hypothetical protein HFH95_09280 [Lachnospiraceae bacterium]|nr:hypothetical protein [uncultured Acetatifactor sp.]MCI8543492.1 hypothetical protein [Lachnospiraceae bacterium]
MEQNVEYRQQMIGEYRAAAEPLFKYLPWMEKSAGRAVSRNYQGNGLSRNSISFPVYDATLMNFVKEAAVSTLMNRNYVYVYTRNRIRSHADEKKLIAGAELKDWEILCGILSKYVLEGRTKATLWGEAVQEDIFLLVLRKMQEIIRYWDKKGR